MNRYKDAIKYYIEHLHIAQRLADRIGEGKSILITILLFFEAGSIIFILRRG